MNTSESWKFRSTNGRYGVDIIIDGPKPESAGGPRAGKDSYEGTLTHKGRAAGKEVFSFTPGQTGVWLTLGEDEVVSGAEKVCEVGLQSSNSVTVILLSAVAITKSYGYKNRSSTYTLWRHGVAQKMGSSELLVAGLIEPERGGNDIPAPQVDTKMAAALKAAGII